MLNFEKLSLENRHIIAAHVDKFDSYSDYNFASLFHWNLHDDIQFAFVGQALILKMTDYITGEKFLTILGEQDVDEAITACKEAAESLQIDTTLRLVPEITVKNIKNTFGLTIEEDIDSHDYILDVDSLSEMRASVYRGKRNLLNRFHRFYEGRYASGPLDLSDETVRTAVMALTDSWRKHTYQSTQETLNEFTAIERAVNHSSHLRLQGFGVYVDGELAGFSLIEDLPNLGVMLHFDKANTEYTGIYEFLKNELAIYLKTQNKTWINFQQDLGLEGLRTMKESYKPSAKLKKHTIRFAQ